MKRITKIVNIRVDTNLKNDLIKLCEDQGLALSTEFREWAKGFIERKSLEKDPELRKFKHEYGRINTTISNNNEKIKALQFENKCLELQAKSYSEIIENKKKELDNNGKK